MRAKITKQGSVTIPKTYRDRLKLVGGSEVDVVMSGMKLEIQPLLPEVSVKTKKSLMDLFGALKPEKSGVTLEDMQQAIIDGASRK
ncbi:MAG: AbrB/MazE/SpoVT family DNA-binding domain-containing protein [Rhodospirillales bacterium]|nr:AbrB/MazE/SpoVT family DNA-binding domain-containing protein [Rhodospirillales bacterium]